MAEFMYALAAGSVMMAIAWCIAILTDKPHQEDKA